MIRHLLYIDPGSGSLLFQVIIAGILGAIYYFKSLFLQTKLVVSTKIGKAVQTKALHPFLICLFFVFYKARYVLLITNLFHLTAIILALAVSSAFIFVLLRFILKNSYKASLLTSLFLLIFLFYDNIHYALSFIMAHAGVLLLIFTAASGFLILRTRRDLARLNTYMNMLFIVLACYEGGASVYCYAVNYPGRQYIQKHNFSIPKTNNTAGPDIYFIVPDEYASSAILKKYWNYDNAEFESFLRKKGFNIIPHASSHGVATQECISQVLNMSEGVNLDSVFQHDILSLSAYRLNIRNSEVVNRLVLQNYRIVNLSIFDLGNTDRFHDFPMILDATRLNRFIFQYTRLGEMTREYPVSDYKTNLSVFENLTGIPDSLKEDKKFVYAHLEMPHGPYYFDRDGKLFENGEGPFPGNEEKNYLDYLIYTNTMLERAIDKILADSDTPPVIIIQGDHGYRALKTGSEKEKRSVFSAFYFPDKDYRTLHDSLSTIQTFKIVFNKYFTP